MAGPLLPTRTQGVGANFQASTIASQSVTVTNAGDTLVVSAYTQKANAAAPWYVLTAVSGAGATWYHLTNGNPVQASGGPAIDVWVGVGASSGAQTVSFTWASQAASNLFAVWVEEWHDLSANALVMAGASVTTATGTSVTPSVTVTPDQLGEVVIAYSMTNNLTETASPGSPYTTVAGPTSTGAQIAGLAYWVTDTLTASSSSWTISSGTWAAVGIILKPAQASGDVIWNDPAATTNPGVLTAQASPDYLDQVNDMLGEQGTGILSGCAVGPNLGSDLKFQVAAGTVLFNGGPVAVAAASAQTITAADATNPRKDLVYVDLSGTVKYLAGTAAATPCLPNPPIFPFVCLAQIDVPANATVCDTGTSTSRAHVTDKRAIVAPPVLSPYYLKPTAALIETHPRAVATANNFTSGTLYLNSIVLPAGMTIGHLAATSGVNPISTPTHYWFALFDSSRNMLAVTADQATAVWAATTIKSLAVAATVESSSGTSFVTRYTGLYYFGVMVVATSPAIGGQNGLTGAYQAAPILSGPSSTSQTTAPTFPFTAAAISGSTIGPWGYVAT